MSRRPLPLLRVATLVAALGLAPAAGAAGAPPSLGSLLQRVPELPDTAQQAATWVDRSGQLVHPGLLALKADIAVHQKHLEGLQLRAAEGHVAQGAIATENLAQGMADVGIDMERLQRDPAYAQQVQERLKTMSPQELMAMSQKMNQPLNQDKRYRNQAQAMVEDTPANRAAAEAGVAYSQAMPSRLEAQHVLWRESDEAAERVRRTPLKLPAGKPAMEWENIGCDAGCRAQWESYAAKVLPLMIARDTEVLRVRKASLQAQKAVVAAEVKKADPLLVAARYGASSVSQAHQGSITAYDAALLAEIGQLIERITESVRSAAVTTHCGPQIVLAPRAVCR
jgi:hypothetical protein